MLYCLTMVTPEWWLWMVYLSAEWQIALKNCSKFFDNGPERGVSILWMGEGGLWWTNTSVRCLRVVSSFVRRCIRGIVISLDGTGINDRPATAAQGDVAPFGRKTTKPSVAIVQGGSGEGQSMTAGSQNVAGGGSGDRRHRHTNNISLLGSPFAKKSHTR